MVTFGEEKRRGCNQDQGGLQVMEVKEQEKEKEEEMIIFVLTLTNHFVFLEFERLDSLDHICYHFKKYSNVQLSFRSWIQ